MGNHSKYIRPHGAQHRIKVEAKQSRTQIKCQYNNTQGTRMNKSGVGVPGGDSEGRKQGLRKNEEDLKKC